MLLASVALWVLFSRQVCVLVFQWNDDHIVARPGEQSLLLLMTIWTFRLPISRVADAVQISG